jgi:hypothetical protein
MPFEYRIGHTCREEYRPRALTAKWFASLLSPLMSRSLSLTPPSISPHQDRIGIRDWRARASERQSTRAVGKRVKHAGAGAHAALRPTRSGRGSGEYLGRSGS